MKADILIVDDEQDIREIVAGILEDEGHETRTAHDSDSALAAISDRAPRLVFLDIWLQGSKLDGLALLDEIQTMHPGMPVVMVSHQVNVTALTGIFPASNEGVILALPLSENPDILARVAPGQ